MKFIKSNNEFITKLNENSNDDITFKIETEEENIIIRAFLNNVKVGFITLEIMNDMYYYFEDCFSEDEYYQMFPKEELVNITHLEVYDEYKFLGIGKKLMNKALDEIKKLKINRVYLNAYPMGKSGLSLEELVNFYKKIGFVEILNQKTNIQMLLKL